MPRRVTKGGARHAAAVGRADRRWSPSCRCLGAVYVGWRACLADGDKQGERRGRASAFPPSSASGRRGMEYEPPGREHAKSTDTQASTRAAEESDSEEWLPGAEAASELQSERGSRIRPLSVGLSDESDDNESFYSHSRAGRALGAESSVAATPSTQHGAAAGSRLSTPSSVLRAEGGVGSAPNSAPRQSRKRAEPTPECASAVSIARRTRARYALQDADVDQMAASLPRDPDLGEDEELPELDERERAYREFLMPFVPAVRDGAVAATHSPLARPR